MLAAMLQAYILIGVDFISSKYINYNFTYINYLTYFNLQLLSISWVFNDLFFIKKEKNMD